MRRALYICALVLIVVGGFAASIRTFSERPDDCLCQDGSAAAGWTWGWTSAASHCSSLCRTKGGGRPLTSEESDRKQQTVRRAR